VTVLRQRATLVWLGLMLATVVTTWGLSSKEFSPVVAVVGTFVIAAVKVRYVVLDFMELRNAPRAARIAFEAWPVVVTAMILAFWFLSR
jgi:Prokaryotic Cytochrome C oxidase subunit IV